MISSNQVANFTIDVILFLNFSFWKLINCFCNSKLIQNVLILVKRNIFITRLDNSSPKTKSTNFQNILRFHQIMSWKLWDAIRNAFNREIQVVHMLDWDIVKPKLLIWKVKLVPASNYSNNKVFFRNFFPVLSDFIAQFLSVQKFVFLNFENVFTNSRLLVIK